MEESIVSYNKDAKISKLCRTCLTDKGEMKSLSGKENNAIFSAVDLLECFIPIKFEMDPSLPSNVCRACYAFIDEINRFKQRCVRTDAALRARINLQPNGSSEFKISNSFENRIAVKKTKKSIALMTDKAVLDDSELNEVKNNFNLKGFADFDDERFHYDSDSDETLSNKIKNRNILDKSILKHDKDLNVSKVKSYVCRRCDFTSRFKWEYTEHRKKTHGKSVKRNRFEEKFKCIHCEYVTHAKTNLVTHLKTHFGSKPFHCEHCQFKTNFRASLQAHIRIHTGEKPFLCDKCDLRFKQLAHLKQHRLTHSDKRPWPCTRCDYKAKAKRHLDNHLRTHTGEKPYMCDLCSFTCANHVNLLSHKRSHSVEKMFKCSVCPYASNFKKNLSMHVAKHSGVKAFECSVCEYRGTCAQNLRAHMISHSQDRPFACVICAYKTKTNSMLNKHMKTHVR